MAKSHTHRHPLRPLVLAVSTALSSACLLQHAALAQTPPREATLPEVKVQGASPADEYAPGISTIGGKTETPLRDIPQSVTVIPRPVIDAQGGATLTQALRNVPGITISAGEGGNIGDNINLRGFSARTDLFLDGMRDRGQYTRDTFFLDSVEVLKGPSSMLFGRGSTGGVINQVSKRPQRRDATEASATLGTESYKRATVDVNRAMSDTSAFRITALAHDTESQRDFITSERFGVAPSLRFGIGTPTEITLNALIQQSRDVPDFGFPLLPETAAGVGTKRKPLNAPANRYYGYLDDRFNQDVTVLGGTIQHRISPTLTLRNQTQHSYYSLDASPSPSGTVTSTVPGVTPTLSTPLAILQMQRQDRDRKIKDTALFNQTDLIAKIQHGPVLHTVTTGVEVGIDDYNFTRHGWTPTNVNINLGNPVNGNRSGARRLQQKVDASSRSMALYANDQIDLNKQWKLVGGLRWDRFDFTGTTIDYSLATGAVTATTPLSKLDTMVSGRSGVIYQPTLSESYYLSSGTSFNPSAEQLTLSAANSTLDPEQNRSVEVGAKWDFMNGNLSVNSALFRVDKTNARTTDPVTGLASLAGKVRVQGIEVGTAGRLSPRWQLIAGYTYLDGKIVSSRDVGTGQDLGLRAEGKTFPNTPRHTVTGWATYKLSSEWEIGGGVVHVSQRYLNNFETALTDAYTRYDAMLAYRQPKYDIRFNLLNLSDEIYFETASGGRATPVEGRKLLATLTYRF
jgi:catecholate siderophore receptor